MTITRKSTIYFFANLTNAALSTILLPIATKILGPDDYGIYAFVTAIIFLASGIAEAGVGIVLAEHYTNNSYTEKRKILISIYTLTLFVSICLGLAVYFNWHLIILMFTTNNLAPEEALLLACLSIPFRTAIFVSTTVFTLQFKSEVAGYCLLIQGLVNFTSTLIALFVFDKGVISLFIGNTLGVISGSIISIMYLRKELWAKPSIQWYSTLLRASPSAAAAGLMESIRPSIEMKSILNSEGTASVGIFNHSKLYYGFIMQVVNSFGYVIWPIALQEARNEKDNFKQVGRMWNIVYFLVSIIGISFAFFANEVINFLTNAKFKDAVLWGPVWIAYLLIQNSGKAATALLYTNMKGAHVARLRAVTVALAIFTILQMGSDISTGTIIIIAFIEIIIFRLLLQHSAQRIRKLPFQDFWVICGSTSILLISILFQEVTLLERLKFYFLTISIFLWLGHNIINDVYIIFNKKYLT